MGLPNATKMLSSLPNGLRAVVSRDDDGDVATLAIRTAINESGQLQIGGVVATSRANVWTLVADFSPAIAAGNVLLVDSVPAVVVDTMTTGGGLLNRAGVVLCRDTVTINGSSYSCNVGILSDGAGGSEYQFLPEYLRGLFIAGERTEIESGQPLVLNGAAFTVETVRIDPMHNVTCVLFREVVNA